MVQYVEIVTMRSDWIFLVGGGLSHELDILGAAGDELVQPELLLVEPGQLAVQGLPLGPNAPRLGQVTAPAANTGTHTHTHTGQLILKGWAKN